YANEVGEAFRIQVHVNWVRFSYVVASGYVAADTAHKTQLEYQASGNRWNSRVAFACLDSLVWQSLASVIVPGLTINRICWAANLTINKLIRMRTLTTVGPLTTRWLVTGIGLGSIPFIVGPIDRTVHSAMDGSLRRFAPKTEQPTSTKGED
uniref:Mitochondrial fission process protein 1 n=2 Tax=Macrostomum lignano TaxID=282301 RepID=A0A1I8GQ61_9PLAT